MTDAPEQTPAVPAPEDSPSRAPRRWGWWRVVLGLLGAPLIALALVLGLIVSTQTGLRLALTAIDDLAPELLHVEKADGRLIGRVRLAGVALRLGDLEVRLGSLSLDWSPLGALAGKVPIREFGMADLEVILGPPREGPDPEDPPSEPISLPTIGLPLTLDISEAWIDGLTLSQRDASEDGRSTLFQAERIGLSGRWKGHRMEVRELTLRLAEPTLLVRAEGYVALQGAYPLEIDLTWGLAKGALPSLAGIGRVSGELGGTLTANHDLTGAVEASLAADLEQVLTEPGWDATLTVRAVDLPAFDAGLPALELAAELATDGDLEAAGLTGRLDAAAADQPELGQLDAELDLAWRDSILRIETVALTEATSEARLVIEGQLDLDATPPTLSLSGTWQGLRWPLAGETFAASPQGEVQVTGSLESLAYRLSATAAGQALPEAEILLQGEANPQGTAIDGLEIALLDGELSGQGEIGWSPSVTWEAELTATDLDPGVQWPPWSGQLGGEIVTTGSLAGEEPELSVKIQDLQGQLRDYPVAASGEVRATEGEVTVEELILESGPSRLRVAGRIGEQLGLDVLLSSPDLSSLLPGASGALELAGDLSGTPDAPALALRVEATEAKLPGVALGRLAGTVELGLAGGAPLVLDLVGDGLGLGGRDWGRLALRGTGTTAEHRLGLELRGPMLDVTVSLSGGLALEPLAYSGRLADLELTSSDYGDWRLTRPSPLEVAPPIVQIGPLCLRDPNGDGGCIEVAQPSEGRWSASLDVDRLDLARLKPVLPEAMALAGSAQAKGAFEGTVERLQGSLRLSLPEGRLGWVGGAADGEALDFSGARLEVEATAGGLASDLTIPLAGLGAIEADLNLPGWQSSAPARAGQPLRGRLRAEVQDLSRIGELVPQLHQVSGRVSADVQLAGTIANPGVRGVAELVSAGFDVPLIGLKVRDLGLEARAAAGDRLELQGEAMLGDGRLDLSGASRQLSAGWATEVRLAGTDLLVANTPEYRVRLTPDIVAEQGPDGIRVRGEVKLPEAAIRPRSLPAGTVTPSDDVVLAGATRPTPLPVDIDLAVVLGDEVSIDAFGVRGDLRGKLRVLKTPERDTPLGDGQLRIVDGTYRVAAGFGLLATIGKPLTIRQGRLIFARTPLSNPGLLLRAEREGGDLTAGVQVLGTLRDPKLTFFSDTDPGMTQSELSSYLITGIPPRRGAEEENRALAVGTYIAPKLYMEYVNSIGDEADKVRLRYELMNNIELQTETGDSQGADIFFKFEN